MAKRQRQVTRTLVLTLAMLAFCSIANAVLPAEKTSFKVRLVCASKTAQVLSEENKKRLSAMDISQERLAKIHSTKITAYIDSVLDEDSGTKLAVATADYLKNVVGLPGVQNALDEYPRRTSASTQPRSHFEKDSFDGLTSCGENDMPIYIDIFFVDKVVGQSDKPNSKFDADAQVRRSTGRYT